MECQIWNLERYARLSCPSTQVVTESDSWEHFDSTTDKLELTVTPGDHLLVHHGKRQLESVHLVGATTWVKGVSKVDSLMIVCKVQATSHRFRVKFSATVSQSGEACCTECVDRLAQYFPIKLPASAAASSQQVAGGWTPSTPAGGPTLEGDVTIGQLTQAIAGSGGSQLPLPFSRYHGNMSGLDLTTAIKLCLTDPGFPAFVGLVEQEIERIKKDF